MKLVVLTPEKEYFNGEVKSVKVPGTTGGFEILNNHAPIVSSLTAGHVGITTTEGGSSKLIITGGFIEAVNNEISILASSVVTE
jgi:F-type H+-transporting ATPase subunit epsilon